MMRGGAAKGLAILFALVGLGMAIPAIMSYMHSPSIQDYLDTSGAGFAGFLMLVNLLFIGGFMLFVVGSLNKRSVRV
jgi:hypothetical protein